MSLQVQPIRTVRAIFEHAARISREQQIDELVRLNADFARDLAGADRCSLWLIDEAASQLWTKLAHGVDTIRIPFGEGLVGACIRDNQVVLVNDGRNDPRLLRRVDQHSGYQTEQILCVPMLAEGKVIGALQLINKPAGFDAKDAGLLGLVAHFAASAIEGERLRQESERARLVGHELDLARAVQARLLPERPPSVVGLDCVGFCRAARSIGGDYYDLLPLHDGRFAFTLGDVSGKGIPAAVMMASIQTLLRSLLQQDSRNLETILADLNRTLYASSTAERYSTLFCGIISADRTTLTYVNAGHVLPYLIHRNGSLERLSGNGLPVGPPPRSHLRPGHRPRSDPEIPSSSSPTASSRHATSPATSGKKKRSTASFSPTSTPPLSRLPELLCAAVDRFAGQADQYDDMTVVALRIA